MTDTAVRVQWRLLSEAGLPSSERPQPSPHHQPHVTLFAGPTLLPGAEAALPGLLAGLDLTVRIAAVMVFGPRRGRCVLVRQVVVSTELLELQGRVADTCGAEPDGHFGPGRWTPHITLAPRIAVDQVSPALIALGLPDELEARVTDCRRWDSERQTAWWLTGERVGATGRPGNFS